MDKALKQRLVGASVLIILAVIVLPMLLSGRSDRLQQESRQIELPAKPDELSIETRRFPVGIPNQSASTTAAASVAPNQSDEQDQSLSVEPDLSSTNKLQPIPDPAPPRETEADIPESPETAANTNDMASTEGPDTEMASVDKIEATPPAVTSITLKSGKQEDLDVSSPADESQNTPRYLVQVASFSSEKNANALAGQLRADNLPVLMDVVDRPAGRLHRVRLGPYAERTDADAVVATVRSKQSDLTPRVLDLRPGDSAPVSTPSDPLVRWVVQVGSFNNSKSAETLVTELRLTGLTAFSEKVSSADTTAYKVRIGPELDRDRATELKRKIKTEHGLDGFVTTQE